MSQAQACLAQWRDAQCVQHSIRRPQADSLFDDILDIADGRRAMMEGSDPDVQRDRLAVDARKWMAGKLKGKYSDKVQHEHSGTPTWSFAGPVTVQDAWSG